ncbi:hypothetical protein OG711_16060 [Streptomyces uncialis]|uniref:hypothetical protein n=1 Tax=Streptomyces uncialis TaxID=1048205 RepID=UPI002E36E605|nr:hypothetical protein [Streptomyces uncialis]
MPGIDACLLEAMTLPGARGAAIVDWTSGLALGSVGESAGGDHEATAVETAEMARAAAEYSVFTPDDHGTPLGDLPEPAGLPAVEDLMVTTRTAFHLIHFVETTFDSSVFLYLWLDRETGNLALARIRLRGLAERLVLG